jgi:hypothetical protein
MAASNNEGRKPITAARIARSVAIAGIFFATFTLSANAQNYAHPTPKPKDQPTSTTQTSVADLDPSRTTESHETSGNRSVDKKKVETRGANGDYQPASETETETVHVNATTTRTVTRTYEWDVNGHRNLAKVTEEDARSSASGDAHVVSTTSNADAEGNLRTVRREVAETKKTGPDAQETKTTLYVEDGNGGLAPAAQTQEQQKTNADHTIQVTKTTLVPTSSNGWQVQEVKESTIKEDGNTKTSEERISQADSEGRLSETSRTVSKETATPTGGKVSTVETYSTDVSGITPDGGLHETRKVTSFEVKNPSGNTTVQQVEQPKPGDPIGGLQVTTKTKYTVQYGGGVEQQQKDTEKRDVNGNFDTVAVQKQKSDQVPAAQAPATPPDNKPK